MHKYVSYLRVSTQKQGFSGLGVEAQRNAVSAYVSGGSGQIIVEFVEVESGAKKLRPVLAEAIARCRREKAVLLIAKLDRLARNVAFVSSLMESGVEFVAVDAPFANRLMLHILAAFAEHEREQISSRTKLALAAAKERGVVLGVNGLHLAARNRREAIAFAETVRPILISGIEKGTTLTSLAEHLNVAGLTTREGVKWSPQTVRRVLRRLNLTLN